MKRRHAADQLRTAMENLHNFLKGEECTCPADDKQKRYLQTWVQPGLVATMNELENGL